MGTDKRRQPWYELIKWWNVALTAAGMFGIFLLLSLLNQHYRAYLDGFFGNVLWSGYGGLCTWITTKRIKKEQMRRVPLSWDAPFEEMLQLASSLYPAALGAPADLRSALSKELRTTLSQAMLRAERKAALYGRFFEIGKIKEIDEACDAADALANIKAELPDPLFMQTAVRSIYRLNTSCASLQGRTPSSSTQEVFAALKTWSAQAQRHRLLALTKHSCP